MSDAIAYSFNVIWYDRVAELDREYVLTYFVDKIAGNSVQMRDIRNKRLFLQKELCVSIQLDDLRPGNVITLHSRQLRIIGYANVATEQLMAQRIYNDLPIESTCALIKPHVIADGKLANILAALATLDAIKDLDIVRIRFTRFTEETAKQFYAEHIGKSFFRDLMEMVLEGPMLALEMRGPGAIAAWRRAIGPTNPEVAKRDSPESLRAKFASDYTRNACHGSACPEDAKKELGIVFSEGFNPVYKDVVEPGIDNSKDTTVVVLTPNFQNRNVTRIKLLADLANFIYRHGLAITGICSAVPVAQDIAEITASYQGVIDHWAAYSDMLSSGLCVAIQVTGNNALALIRKQWAGPFDPVMAKVLAPETLRARYGGSILENLVFCTDIPDESELHTDFWFRTVKLQ